jgi:hypothetical protein
VRETQGAVAAATDTFTSASVSTMNVIAIVAVNGTNRNAIIITAEANTDIIMPITTENMDSIGDLPHVRSGLRRWKAIYGTCKRKSKLLKSRSQI